MSLIAASRLHNFWLARLGQSERLSVPHLVLSPAQEQQAVVTISRLIVCISHRFCCAVARERQHDEVSIRMTPLFSIGGTATHVGLHLRALVSAKSAAPQVCATTKLSPVVPPVALIPFCAQDSWIRQHTSPVVVASEPSEICNSHVSLSSSPARVPNLKSFAVINLRICV